MNKEHPILFKTEMVLAILAGKKTQTRRVVKPQPIAFTGRKFIMPDDAPKKWHDAQNVFAECSPYGNTGNTLWVREAFLDADDYPCAGYHEDPENEPKYLFRAECPEDQRKGLLWKSSIFMPREAARIILEIKNIRIERLQSITEEDAVKEGTPIPVSENHKLLMPLNGKHLPIQYFNPINTENYNRAFYAALWDDINGKKHPWISNPWVWVIEFERIK
jgi:hypothetical protein